MSDTKHEQQHTHSLTCEACGSHVPALRRGRCPFCYLRWTETRPVGLGAACAVCGERRRENLRSVEFQRKWLNMCHNCATRTFQMQPLPSTIEAIRQRLSRDRRWRERRVGRNDQRIFRKERRVGERRQALPTTLGEYIDAADLVVEIVEETAQQASSEDEQATRIAFDEERAEEARLEALAAELAEAEAKDEIEALCADDLPDGEGAKVIIEDDVMSASAEGDLDEMTNSRLGAVEDVEDGADEDGADEDGADEDGADEDGADEDGAGEDELAAVADEDELAAVADEDIVVDVVDVDELADLDELVAVDVDDDPTSCEGTQRRERPISPHLMV